VKNSDLLKSILIKLRTRPARTTFRWVKGHADNYGNNQADTLANEGRISNSSMRVDEEEWLNSHPVLQDGARLQTLEAKHIYDLLIKWYTRNITPILHQETLDEAKNKIQETTSLRPTNEKLLKGLKVLGVPPRLRDHLRRCMLIGRSSSADRIGAAYQD
jgi:hypothetical protein